MTLRWSPIKVGLVATIFAGFAWALLHRDHFQPAVLQTQIGRLGPWAPAVFILTYACATVVFVPGSLLTVAGGALFGPWWGTVWNLSGATTGSTLAFLAARYVASDWFARNAGERLVRLIRGVEQEGWRFVAFVRLVPLFPFNLVNYLFGLTRIRLGEYILASVVSMAPGAVAYTYLGYAGREAASGQTGAIRKGMLALALLALVAFLPRLVRRLRGPRFTDAPTIKRHIERNEELAVIDVRTGEEFDGPLGHIVGARNLPLAELSQKLAELAELRAKPVVLVCRTDKRSAKAAEMLASSGFENVSVLRDGMEGWNQSGFLIERN